MRIAINHTTHYQFTSPAHYGVQRLRLKPRDGAGQTVCDWSVSVEGARIEAEYEDQNLNITTLLSFGGDAHDIVITCAGLVETSDIAGMIGKHTGTMPLWAYLRQTDLTKPGPRLAKLVARSNVVVGDSVSGDHDAVAMLHKLSATIRSTVLYENGHTNVDTTAETALALGHGVCQDHAHIFIGASRALGIPARYVSGYLFMEGTDTQDAGHGWAEAHIRGLGWVGFDVSNAISPDERYVRLAVGADYRSAAPITGISQGAGDCALAVSLQVGQHIAEQ